MAHQAVRWAMLGAVLGAGRADALEQPGGIPIPQGGGLSGLFASRGEAINALADASADPQTFVPSCNLSFEVLQRNAGYQNAFGWYNVTGDVPTELHEFLHCSDPIGTVVPLPNIQSDPNYLGGEIGFYEGVINNCSPNSGPESYLYVFYSERALNPDSSQDNPYYHLLVYNSTAVPNAFYFGWEDLISGGDNDFDDLTTFVSGITCSGGGGPCETGESGVCAPGKLQCQNGVLVCVGLSAPTDETCDGFDNDCDGEPDDGDLCPDGEICDDGRCVPECGAGEFLCENGEVCDPEKGLCVDSACVGVDCDTGTCVDGACVLPCDDVVCPRGQTCVAGLCLDPCDAIDCDDGQICALGTCIDPCSCMGCPDGETCRADDLCVPDACADVNCPDGEHCDASGDCVSDCDGVVCPAGQICAVGECVADPGGQGGSGGQGGDGGSSFVGVGGGTNGTGGDGGGSPPTSGGASAGGSGGAGGATPILEPSSCGCNTVGASRHGAPWWVAIAAAALLRRRRE